MVHCGDCCNGTNGSLSNLARYAGSCVGACHHAIVFSRVGRFGNCIRYFVVKKTMVTSNSPGILHCGCMFPLVPHDFSYNDS